MVEEVGVGRVVGMDVERLGKREWVNDLLDSRWGWGEWGGGGGGGF
jgi:hypothetical protein